MKVAIMTRLLAKWYVDVDAAHFLVFSFQSQFSALRLKAATENYLVTRFSLSFTKASQPE